MPTQVLTDIPPGELPDILSDLKYQGFGAIVTPQENGLFTVTAQPIAAVSTSSSTSVGNQPIPAEVGNSSGVATGSIGSAQPPATTGEPNWKELLATYRGYTGISDQLKIASLAQWILESGRGTSALAKQHFNFGGLKFRERMKGYADFVDYKGSDGDQTLYCKFNSTRAFIEGYWHFISSGPYGDWKSYANDGAGYIRHIGPSYAGDPSYIVKVLKLFDEARSLLGFTNMPGTGSAATDGVTEGTFAKLAIVVGHNRIARGATGVSPINRSEFEFNSIVATRMRDQAPHYNLDAQIFFREPSTSYTKEIRDVYQKVEAWGPDCAIELHFNSSADSNAGGTEVLYRNGSNEGRELALTLVESIQMLLGLPLRRGGTGLGPLNPGERGAGSVYALEGVATVLVEPFFGSNADEALHVSVLGEEALALSYLRGARDWVVTRSLVS